MKTHFKIALVMALVYLVLGNFVGYLDTENIAAIIFAPYIFVYGLSDYAGWGILSFVLELLIFGVSFLVFIPFALFFDREKNVPAAKNTGIE